MTRWLLWIIDHPLLAGGLIATLTIVFAVQIPRLEIDTSTEGLMVRKDPARQHYERVKEKFGSDSLTTVLLKADDVFTTPVLQAVKRLSDALERTDGVTRVESLTTVNNIKGDRDSLNIDPLVGAVVPTTPAHLAPIRADALANRVFVGNIVSADARATAINIYTDAKPKDHAFNQRFSDRVETLIKGEAGTGLTLYQIGAPLTKRTFGEYIEQDQITLAPISLAVLFLILLLAFRAFSSPFQLNLSCVR